MFGQIEMKMSLIAVAAAVALLAGCRHSPYDYAENWLIREEAVRPFAVQADVIYLQGFLYTNIAALAEMNSYANSEVGRGRFNGVARVFSPLVAGSDDLELAMEWYFSHGHSGNRPFVFIGEGECGALLKEYEEANSEGLKQKGLVLSCYTENSHEGFVKDWIVRDVRDALTRRRYRDQWGRDMPSNMIGR